MNLLLLGQKAYWLCIFDSKTRFLLKTKFCGGICFRLGICNGHTLNDNQFIDRVRDVKTILIDGKALGFICVLVTAVLFGSTYSLAKLPLNHVDPLILSAIIYPLAFIVMIPIARASFRMTFPSDLKYLIIISVLGAVAAPLFLFYGLKSVSASDGAILANAQILFTIILSSIFFGEKPNGLLGYSAIVIVLIGLFLASTEPTTTESILQYEPGKILILGAMVSWALDNNLSRRLVKISTIQPSKIAMLKFLLGSIILFLILISTRTPILIVDTLFDIEKSEWVAIIVLAVFGFAVALFFLLEGLKRIGTIKTMIALAFTPITGIVIAMLGRGESLNPIEIVATGMIVIGIIMISKS